MAYNKYRKTVIFFLLLYPVMVMGSQPPVPRLLPEIHSIIHEYFIPEKEVRFIKDLQHSGRPQEEIESITNEHLNQTIKDVRSLLLSQKKHYLSMPVNKFFIKKLARIYSQDPIEVAIRLNTAGSFTWLATYIKKNIHALNHAIILFLNAASDANLRTFMTLAKAGVPATAADRSGNTALMFALQNTDAKKKNSQKRIVQWLVTNGAAINQRDENGSFPLLEAARFNNTDMFKLLFTHGANPNMKGGPDQSTPLQWAVSYDNQEEINALLSYGLKHETINLADSRGNTPLGIARKKKLTAVQQLLIKHGAHE